MQASRLCLAAIATASVAFFSTPALAQDPPASTDGTVTVHINSDKPVSLQRRPNAQTAWETVCMSPCDQRAPLGEEYQVTGVGLNPSKPFRLATGKEKVTLDVSVGDPNKAKMGLYIAVGGGVVALTGAIIIAAAVKPSDTFPDSGVTHVSNTNVLFAGGLLILTGVVAGIYGGATMLNSKEAQVEGDTSKAGPAEKAAHDAGPKTASATPAATTPAFVIPVLKGTF